MVVGVVVSVLLFSNQTLFTGLVARAVPEIGDITFFVGTFLAAGLMLSMPPSASRRMRPSLMLLVTASSSRRRRVSSSSWLRIWRCCRSTRVSSGESSS